MAYARPKPDADESMKITSRPTAAVANICAPATSAIDGGLRYA
ncbi:hypothetical protein [Paractinoplanes toevensis]|nr:hypothetical protein [Actinoplanes toevensis]